MKPEGGGEGRGRREDTQAKHKQSSLLTVMLNETLSKTFTTHARLQLDKGLFLSTKGKFEREN